VVLRTAPGKESNAAANAENKLNLLSCAPRIRERGILKPMFPGYAFARTKTSRWMDLLRLRHVRGLLMAWEKDTQHPSWVPDQLIQQIQANEESNLNPQVQHLGFTYRQRLAMVGGPFTHGLFLGVVDASPGNRVRILFELLGREFQAEVDLKDVDARIDTRGYALA
jgi:transcription antitermination factor NusG